MKNILYIHQYFKTPKEPGGTRSYWISKELLSKGYNVTMLTSRNEQERIICKEVIDGINVIYIKNSYDNSFGFLKRVISFLKFMFFATWQAFKVKNISLVIATSTPLTVGFPALLLKWFKGKRFIFEVRDLWPEVPISMGIIKNRLLISLLEKFEKSIYHNSHKIVALSPGMEEGIIEKGVAKTKVTFISNMSKIDEFFVRDKNKELMEKLGLDRDYFYAIHFGAMGIANGLDYIIDAAKILKKKNNSTIKILFAGGGMEEIRIKNRCKSESISNVMFLGKFGMKEMAEIVNIADCSIVTFLNLKILGTNSPNKLFDSLSAQKPIIVNSSGWTKTLVEENECGAYVDPTNPEELSDLLIEWSLNMDLVNKQGANARSLAEKTYDKKILTNKFSSLIEEVFINL